MPMPEAAMNEHDAAVLWQHNIWLAWKAAYMQSEAIPQAV
jgi:hypothetical protein